MIVRTEKLDIDPGFDIEVIAKKEQIVFFDIETTGLSAGKAGIYLIGTVTYEKGAWRLKQFFAESIYDEPQLLDSFFKIISERKRSGRVILISYNGDGFDIPFIKKCVRQYSLNHEFTGTVSLDLIKKVRPYKALLGLPDCSLKAVERHMGRYREDTCAGGELIYVYEEYLSRGQSDKHRDELLYTLLLHNAEDIADLLRVLGVTAYESAFSGGFEPVRNSLCGNVWDIHARLNIPLPSGIYRENELMTVSMGEEDRQELNIAVNLFKGRLKYFFADYKNYYYLPKEDMAIHKSVGEYVARSSRRQATARTCYQNREGLFVPEYEPVFAPVFYKEYKTKPFYGEISGLISENENTIDSGMTKRYIMSVLNGIK